MGSPLKNFAKAIFYVACGILVARFRSLDIYFFEHGSENEFL